MLDLVGVLTGELIDLPVDYFFIAFNILSYYYSNSASSAFNLSNFAIHSKIYLSFLCFFYCLF